MAGNTRFSFSYLIIISLLSLHSTIIDGASGVYFLDSLAQRYIRPSSSDEISSMSLPEVGAAVSVLLGFAPPATLSTKSSSKLNEVLAPNPFEKPSVVLLLEVTGAEGSHFLVGLEELSATHKRDMLGITNKAEIDLPGEESVSVLTLESEDEQELSEKELVDFASWLHGSYVNVAKEQFSGELAVPLKNEEELRFDMSKEGTREFIKSLVSLSHNCHNAMKLHHDLFGSGNNKPELIVARFGAIEAMKNKHKTENVAQAMKLAVHVISKMFASLHNAYKGEMVGVVVYSSASEPMVRVTHDSRPSARWLEEASFPQNDTAVVAQQLVRRTVAWSTGIMLIIATLLGIYFLLNMPLTRDTLLYSNAKLD